MAKEVTDFQTEVIERSRTLPVLVDFWAEWCAPCRMLGPVLERLAEKHAGEWELVKVNTERNPRLAARYEVSGIPNVKLFVDGEIADEFTGALPEASVEQWMRTSIPGRSDRQVREAYSLLLQGNPDRGRALLRQVLEQDPGNVRAKLLLAQMAVFTNPGEAKELLEGIGPGDEGYELAESVRSFADLFEHSQNPSELPDSPAKPHCLNAIALLRAGDFDRALDEFIAAMEADRRFGDGCARKACVAIFHYLGEDSEITKKHRRAFGAALHA